MNTYFKELFPLLDLLVNKPILSEKQFHLVKKSSINSIKKDKENPFNICFENWRKIVYAKHPYAFNTLGYEKDVTNITHENILTEFRNFKKRKKYIISNNNLINGNCIELIDKKIVNEKLSYSINPQSKEHRFICSHSYLNQTIIMLGNQTCSRKSNEHLPLKILESHLSFGMSSVLFKLFREKNGITYDVGVFNAIRKDNAPFLIYLSVSNKNAILAFKLLSTLWNELLFSLIPDLEIYLAKEKLKSSYLINNQCLDEILQRKIQLISYGMSPNSEYEYFSEVEKVLSEDIQKLTNKYFANPFLSVTGDKKICDEIQKLWNNNFSN